MSLLRLGAYSAALTRSFAVDRSVQRFMNGDYCHLCLRIRNKTWATIYQRHYSAIPKKEDGKKRFCEQSQLLDVLEARIQQLQSDAVVDVKHSKVQIIKMQQKIQKTSPGNSQKNLPGEKAEMLKSGPSAKKGGTEGVGPSKTHASRWMEKLKREKWINPKKQTSHRMHDKTVVGKNSKGSSMRPGTSTKTITTGKRSETKTKGEDSKTSASTTTSSKISAVQKNKGGCVSEMSAQEKLADKEFDEIEELDVDIEIDQQSSSAPERLLEDKEGNRYGDPQLRIRCYLEACVFIDDVARAQSCLLSHHRQLSKRMHLSISAYNIVMRMWAKRGSFNHIRRLFVLIEEAGLKPNVVSYSAALECIGRMPDHLFSGPHRCLQQMEVDGLSVDDVFRQCVFKKDEREMVLRAVRLVHPEYQPIVSKDQPVCSLPLVKQDVSIFIHSLLWHPPQIGFIKPHPIVTQIQRVAMETKLTFDSYVMPMLCPPIPWTSPKSGAYLLTPTKLMRSTDGAIQHQLLLEKSRDEDLHAVLDSLNQVGSCPWKINKPLLDIIISIFNDKGNDKLCIPPPLSEAPEIPRFNPHDPSYTQAEKAYMKREGVKAKKKVAEMHSLRMDALYKLSIANHMRDEIFWFPHNMDFRGRTYPRPPYFNHLGSDVTRGLLLFAEGQPLGPKGLVWLKIHLVNLTGLKKCSSLAGRLEYADSIMEDILDSADHPLDGRKWWMNADEPWQALACCMEIANASRSPDHTKFISYFPVHQDGSCNGLQHYAALGRDVIGATSVNLMPCEVPQDVYSGVAQQVEEFRARDAEKGLKIAQVLEGFISRKVVKQTVMTVVYGVTRYGGRLQIEKRLKEIDDFPKDYIWEASHYLVKQVFSSLKEMFTGTREIQEWLTESASLIAKSGRTVEWVTPLGLPIVQPYHRIKNQTLKSSMQNLSIHISHDANEKPDSMKQKNAFPPNFIHSLDSTHMMLTSLHCYRAGLTFVSVHDCYWTHAVTVDIMNRMCREQFVALHSQPILEELSRFLLKKYCSRPPVVSKPKKFEEHVKMAQLLASVPQTGELNPEHCSHHFRTHRRAARPHPIDSLSGLRQPFTVA
uniref:DNA-directed RNA polymerase n=1 Tax=Sinocyclocheilus grahami TaxID=75366 RepID=A0A672LHW1_SINGR